MYGRIGLLVALLGLVNLLILGGMAWVIDDIEVAPSAAGTELPPRELPPDMLDRAAERAVPQRPWVHRHAGTLSWIFFAVILAGLVCWLIPHRLRLRRSGG